jgi:hypothetical protein
MNFSCVDTCLVPIRYIQHGNAVMEQRVKCLRGHLRSPSYVHQDVLGLSPLERSTYPNIRIKCFSWLI